MYKLHDCERSVAPAGGMSGDVGRPKGSRNRTTRQWVEYLQSQHGSPLEALLKIGLAPLPIVAAELGEAWDDLDSKQRLELWKAQLSALQACLPYMHQKLRPDVTINDMRVTQVVLSYGSGQAIAGQQDRETLTIDVGDVGDGAA